jgi:hypothetical protein
MLVGRMTGTKTSVDDLNARKQRLRTIDGGVYRYLSLLFLIFWLHHIEGITKERIKKERKTENK